MCYNSKTKEIGILIEKISYAKSSDDFEEIYSLLEDIYLKEGKPDEQFRHEYAAISGKINELFQQKEIDLNQLVENMDSLYESCKRGGKPYLKSLFKLKDHINLEVFRMQYADKKEESLKANLKQYEDDVKQFTEFIEREADVVKDIRKIQEGLSKKNEELSEKQEAINEKVEETKRVQEEITSTSEDLKNRSDELQIQIEKNTAQYVSILGIFAAILLAFIGGIIFTNSVLENIDKASVYRIVVIMIIVGLVMYNSIYLLLNFIARMTYKTMEIKFGNSAYFVNGILILILIVTFVFWKQGIVEQRNDIIDMRHTMEQMEK